LSSVAAIVLAAGASVRLGVPKQLVRLGPETLLERAVRVALEADLNPVFGILPPDLMIEPTPAGMIRIVNRESAEGMASSIRAGLRALAASGTAVSGAIILACDQPAVTARHLRELATGVDDIVASAYSGRKGVPAYFPAAAFEELLALRGDVGARELLKTARTIPLPDGDLDVDTIQDLDRARKLYSA
jgi:molybdenum cofactor cytidylyltransferase